MTASMDVGHFDGTPDQIPAARRFVRDAMGGEHPCRDEAVLLASEIATNAVQHTATGRRSDGGTGAFTVVVVHDDGWVYVQVIDEGAVTIPCTCGARLDGENGRGVALIRELAWQWGYASRRLGDREHGVVWFVLGRPHDNQLNGQPRPRS
ncbi:MAG: ATP-binding protein [Streptosporangiales bacterium]|nr:ATP-binding protein [Streptosporangiales bacterium]